MSVAYSKLVVHHHYMYTVQQTFAGSRRRSRPSRLEVSLTIVAQIPISLDCSDLIVRVAGCLGGRRAAGESAKAAAGGGRCALEALYVVC